MNDHEWLVDVILHEFGGPLLDQDGAETESPEAAAVRIMRAQELEIERAQSNEATGPPIDVVRRMEGELKRRRVEGDHGAAVTFHRVMTNGPTGYVRVEIDSGVGDVLRVEVLAEDLLDAVGAETYPGDLCTTVEVDGEPVRVQGSGQMSPEAEGAVGDLVRAVHARFGAEGCRKCGHVKHSPKPCGLPVHTGHRETRPCSCRP